MPTPPLSEDVLRQTVDALQACGGNQTRAAESLGIARGTFQTRLSAAKRAGMVEAGPDVDREAARQGYAPEHDMTHTVPDGYEVKGVSTYYNRDGKPIGQWVKSAVDNKRQMEIFQEAVAGFCDQIERVAPMAAPEFANSDLMTVYPVGDHHLGMLSWREETGADYDLKIGERLLTEAMRHLVACAPASGTAVIAIIGDFLHTDGFAAVTPQHGNLLDADSRYPKMVRVAIRCARKMIDMALAKHERVHVIVEIGNHDMSSAVFLAACLSALYENEPRVVVDDSPAKFHYFRFGKVLLGTHHGDTVKPDKLGMVMAADRPKEWGETEFRYWFIGHIHHKSAKSFDGQEFTGCIVESLGILPPADAYAAGRGYRSARVMKAITYSRNHGEASRTTVNPAMLAA